MIEYLILHPLAEFSPEEKMQIEDMDLHERRELFVIFHRDSFVKALFGHSDDRDE